MKQFIIAFSNETNIEQLREIAVVSFISKFTNMACIEIEENDINELYNFNGILDIHESKKGTYLSIE